MDVAVKTSRRPARNVAALLLVLLALLAPAAAHPQPVFSPNNAFDFRSTHLLKITGTTLAQPGIQIDTDTDWGLFKLMYSPSHVWEPAIGRYVPGRLDSWSPDGVAVDWTGTGEQWVALRTDTPESYAFPPPPNGISEVHNIAVRIHLWRLDPLPGDPNHRAFTTLVRYVGLTNFAGPPVFTTPDGDALIQMRNEDASRKGPILIVEGIDPVNATSMDTYYVLTKQLIDDLYSQNREVFFLNFHDATRDLAANAAVVRAALRTVHQTCPNSAIGLAGMSMGGVIARYALAESEQDGEDHHVGLYISYDSPQQKAHANGGLQDWLYLQDSNQPAIAALQAVLKSPAAKQMLGYDTYDRSQHDHNLFYDTLNHLNIDGYPHRCRNAAISNGTRKSAYGADRKDTFLLTLEVLLLNFDVLVHDTDADEIDVRPGSIQVKFEQQQYGVLFSHRTMFFGLVNLPDIFYRITTWFDPVYMPTASTLDLREPVNYDTDGNITTDGGSRFDTTYTQVVPMERPYAYPHNAVTSGTMATVAQWLASSKKAVHVSYTSTDGGSIPSDVFQVAIGGSVLVAPKTVSADGRTVQYSFLKWDDGSTENPRMFEPSDLAVHTAVLKAHLATGSSGLTWAGTQRRIALTTDGTCHAAYESGGSVWYLRNANGGWEAERQLNEYGGQAQDVAIGTYSWGWGVNEIAVAWIDYSAAATVGATLFYRPSDIGNGESWEWTRGISPYATVSTPVLPDAHALFYADSGDFDGGMWWRDGGIFYVKNPDRLPPASGSQLVPGTFGVSSLPAVCTLSGCEDIGNCGYGLAFIRDGMICAETFYDPNRSDGSAAVVLSTGPDSLTSPGWSATNPAIVSSGTDVLVAWEEVNGSAHRIAFRQLSGSRWSSTVYFTHGSDVPIKPVLGLDNACGTVNLLWECSGHIARVTRGLSGSVWGAVEDLGLGTAPSIVATQATAIWTTGTTVPYSLVFGGDRCTRPGPTVNLAAACDPNNEGAWILSWTAAADDSIWASSGPVTAYDVHHANSSITSESWGTAPSIGGPVPGAPGSTQTWSMSVPVTQYVRLKSMDHAGHWSALSNELTIYPVGDCGGWWYGGGGGGGCGRFCEGGLVARGATVSSLRGPGGGVDSVGTGENTILNSTPTGARGVDLLPIETWQNSAGLYLAHLRVAGGFGTLVDAMKLLFVDHSAGTESFACGSRVVTGRRSQASQATTEAGADVTNLLNGTAGILNADSAVAVTIATPLDASQTPLIIECANGGARGYPIVVESQSRSGWQRIGTVYPRLLQSAIVVDSVPAGPVRLRFTGYAQVSSVARLAQEPAGVTSAWGTLEGALSSSAGDVRSTIGLEDTVAAALVGPDTLWAIFSGPPVGQDVVRSAFLGVSATPVFGAAARSYGVSHRQTAPVQFRLYQNVPNPFQGSTLIRFDLPVGRMVRLDVFDVSGRRIRSLINHFMPPGHHSVEWNERDEAGRSVGVGVYFYQLQADTFRDRKKLTVMP